MSGVRAKPGMLHVNLGFEARSGDVQVERDFFKYLSEIPAKYIPHFYPLHDPEDARLRPDLCRAFLGTETKVKHNVLSDYAGVDEDLLYAVRYEESRQVKSILVKIAQKPGLSVFDGALIDKISHLTRVRGSRTLNSLGEEFLFPLAMHSMPTASRQESIAVMIVQEITTLLNKRKDNVAWFKDFLGGHLGFDLTIPPIEVTDRFGFFGVPPLAEDTEVASEQQVEALDTRRIWMNRMLLVLRYSIMSQIVNRLKVRATTLRKVPTYDLGERPVDIALGVSGALAIQLGQTRQQQDLTLLDDHHFRIVNVSC
jgi:hypothetical protein